MIAVLVQETFWHLLSHKGRLTHEELSARIQMPPTVVLCCSHLHFCPRLFRMEGKVSGGGTPGGLPLIFRFSPGDPPGIAPSCDGEPSSSSSQPDHSVLRNLLNLNLRLLPDNGLLSLGIQERCNKGPVVEIMRLPSHFFRRDQTCCQARCGLHYTRFVTTQPYPPESDQSEPGLPGFNRNPNLHRAYER